MKRWKEFDAGEKAFFVSAMLFLYVLLYLIAKDLAYSYCLTRDALICTMQLPL